MSSGVAHGARRVSPRASRRAAAPRRLTRAPRRAAAPRRLTRATLLAAAFAARRPAGGRDLARVPRGR
jgi:hypothetical protein